MTTSSLPPMPTRLLWNLVVLILCYSSVLCLSWVFSLNFIVSTSDQPLSSLPVPDKLLETILSHSVLTTLFGSLKSRFITCHSDGIVLSKKIGDFIIRSNRLYSMLLHPLVSSSVTSLCQLTQSTAYSFLKIFSLVSKTLDFPKFFFYIVFCFFSNFLDSLSSFSYSLNADLCWNNPGLCFLYYFLLGTPIYSYSFNFPLYVKTPTSLSLATASLTSV